MSAPDNFETWRDALKLLQEQHSTDRATRALVALDRSISDSIDSSGKLAWLSKATHRKLLAKEVPRRLAAAAAKAHLHRWTSAAARATLAALQQLVTGMLAGPDQGSTTAALRQQLQQSGLLTALPGVLLTAAQEVSKFAADPALLASLPSSAGGPTKDCAPDAVAQHACDLLNMLPLLQRLWDPESLLHSPLASTIEPTVKLTAAGVELMCSYLTHHQPQQQQQEEEKEKGTTAAGDTRVALVWLVKATQLTTSLVADMLASELQQMTDSIAAAPSRSAARTPSSQTQKHGDSQQVVQQLLLSPDWRRVSGFLLVAHCYALQRAEQQPAATPAAVDKGSATDRIMAGRSSTSSMATATLILSESEKDAQAYIQAAAFAADWQDELPASHSQLLQLIGCSSKGVLWAAGLLAARSQNPSRELGGFLCEIAAASTSATKWAHERSSQQAQGPCDVQACVTADCRCADAATDVLLASVMLHCAAHLVAGDPSHTQRDTYLRLCTAAAELAASAWLLSQQSVMKVFASCLAAPGKQLTSASTAAQHFAPAEGEHVFFLQHLLSGLLASLRNTTTAGSAHGMPREAATAAGGQHTSKSSNSGGSAHHGSAASNGTNSSRGCRSGTASSKSNSITTSSSMSVAHASQAVKESMNALNTASCFATSRLALQYGRQPAGSEQGNDGRGEAEKRAGLFAKNLLPNVAGVPACMQDCVRLAATAEHLQLQALPIWTTTFCTPHNGSGIATSRFLCGLATPPGSAQQQQLFGLMCSLLKTVQVPAATLPRVQSGVKVREDVSTQYHRMTVVAGVAAGALDLQPQVAAIQAAGISASRGLPPHSSGSPTQKQQAAAKAAAGPVARSAAAAAEAITQTSYGTEGTLLMVPWLVLLGRCCLILARPQYFESFVKDACARVIPMHSCGIVRDLVDTYHTTWLARLQFWLLSSSASAHLAAAGFDATGLLQALEDTLTALEDSQDAALIRRRLHALGVCLSSLPLSWGCNSPVCTNLQGPTEAGIVQGKGHVCRGCHMARYCDKACQALHWKHHKPVCKAIAAAAAAQQGQLSDLVALPCC